MSHKKRLCVLDIINYSNGRHNQRPGGRYMAAFDSKLGQSGLPGRHGARAISNISAQNLSGWATNRRWKDNSCHERRSSVRLGSFVVRKLCILKKNWNDFFFQIWSKQIITSIAWVYVCACAVTSIYAIVQCIDEANIDMFMYVQDFNGFLYNDVKIWKVLSEHSLNYQLKKVMLNSESYIKLISTKNWFKNACI